MEVILICFLINNITNENELFKQFKHNKLIQSETRLDIQNVSLKYEIFTLKKNQMHWLTPKFDNYSSCPPNSSRA